MKALNTTLALILITVFILSCSSDDDSSDSSNQNFDGSINAMEDFFSPDVIQGMQNLGFRFNTGSNPPNTEGEYLFSPYILQNSSVENDNIGSTFLDYYASFNNQNTSNLTVDFEGYHPGVQSDKGFGAFLAGNNNEFTLLLKINSTLNGYTAQFAYAISGKIINGGIENIQLTNFMLDDNDAPEGVFIKNNTGRLLVDQDQFSPLQ